MAEASKRITGGELGDKQATVERACKAARLSAGDSIVVIQDSKGYIYTCEGTATGDVAAQDYPNCPDYNCHNYRPEIHEICHDLRWPPGRPILIYDSQTDSFCYCYCR